MDMIFKDKILLINCPFGDLQNPYLGLANVASHLNHHGYPTDVLDLNIQFYHILKDLRFWDRIYPHFNRQAYDRDRHLFVEHIRRATQDLLHSDYKIFGFTAHGYNILVINEIAEALDKNNAGLIIMGGPSIQLEGERALLYDSDNVVFVQGQGEPTLLPLMQDYQANTLNKLYREHDYPPPAHNAGATTFDEFDLSLYLDNSLPVLFNYGCHGRCAYCNEYVFFKRVTTKNPTRLVSEIKYYMEKTGTSTFNFNDLAINANPRVLIELCRHLAREVKILWMASATPNKFFTVENCDLLRASGCDYLRFGLESGSKRVAKLMNKPFRLEDATRAFRNCTRSGIKVGVNLIVGFPGETELEFQECLDFIARNKEFIHQINGISTCFISGQSKLETHPDQFDIVMPPKDHWYCWSTRDGANTIEVRKQRSERLVRFLQEQGVRFFNIEDDMNKNLMSS